MGPGSDAGTPRVRVGWGAAHGPSRGQRSVAAPHGVPAAAPPFSPWSLTLAQGLKPQRLASRPLPPHAPATTSAPKVGQTSPWTSLRRPAPGPPQTPHLHPSSPPRPAALQEPEMADVTSRQASPAAPFPPPARLAGETVSVQDGEAGGGEGRAVLRAPHPHLELAARPRLRQPPSCPPRPCPAFWAATNLSCPPPLGRTRLSPCFCGFSGKSSCPRAKPGPRGAAPPSLPSDRGAP